MIIRNKSKNDVRSSEITPQTIYDNRKKFRVSRRTFLKSSVFASSALVAGKFVGGAKAQVKGGVNTVRPEWLVDKVKAASAQSMVASWATEETLTPEPLATTYNNFYEFGTDKSDPSRYAHEFNPIPWTVKVQGAVDRPGNYQLEDFLAPHKLENRVYRLRCVEAWSMVIPWVGFPLKDLIKAAKPKPSAKYVKFTTLNRPKEMRGQRSFFSTIDWPYVEGLRMDEAMNDLTFMAVGVYGSPLPNQNGAPLRLVLPWKYGFKSIKSIVKIEFTDKKPVTSWSISAPSEYGFYANVNPNVDHPRWSQGSERRLPSSFWSPNRIETLMFNGYEDQVAHMYEGMDLRRNY